MTVSFADSVTHAVLRVHQQLYVQSGGRVGHRMLGPPSLLLRRRARARVLERSGPEFDRLWKLANANSRDRYDGYQKRTKRAIPIVVLTPG